MIWQCGEINAPEATARRRGAGVPDRNLHMAGFGYRVLLSRKSSEPAPGYRHSRIGLEHHARSPVPSRLLARSRAPLLGKEWPS